MGMVQRFQHRTHEAASGGGATSKNRTVIIEGTVDGGRKSSACHEEGHDRQKQGQEITSAHR